MGTVNYNGRPIGTLRFVEARGTDDAKPVTEKPAEPLDRICLDHGGRGCGCGESHE